MPKIKSKSAVICILMIALWPDVTFGQSAKLVRKKVNDRISIVVPQDWIPMDGLDFSQRYPSVRAPLAAFTNTERTVDFSVNISATQWPDANIEMSKRFFKSSILNTFDRVEMINEGINEIGRQNLIFFEFESRIDGNRREEGTRDAVMKYTYIQYWVTTDRTIVFTFNAPRRLREEWQETARKMMLSLKLN